MIDVGTIIDERYVASEPIGAGGEGEVWLGHDKRDDRRVTIKAVDLSGDSAAAECRRARFHRAAELGSSSAAAGYADRGIHAGLHGLPHQPVRIRH